MGCLRNRFIAIALFAFCKNATAGVETPLLLEIQGECTVRVVHDATPDSATGTLVFRSFQRLDGISNPCDLSPAQVVSSLGRGVAVYRAEDALKPVTSVFVGRISRYPWVREAWQAQARAGSYDKLGVDEFNALVGSPEIGGPFADALRINGLEPGGASCEKRMFHDNGAPLDGLCWIVIQPH